ncbi:hypothetical protein BZ164_03925, partial [Pseudomonas veronii]
EPRFALWSALDQKQVKSLASHCGVRLDQKRIKSLALHCGGLWIESGSRASLCIVGRFFLDS